MKKIRVFMFFCLAVFLFASCRRSAFSDRTGAGAADEQNTVQDTVSMTSTEENTQGVSVPEFLYKLADEVILDETEFTVWGELIGWISGYTRQGFIPCELVVEGERCRGLYTEDGLVIVEKHTDEYDYIFAKNGEKLQLSLEGLCLYDQWLSFHFYDVDGDGNDELLMDGYTGYEGNPVCHAVRQDTMTEIPIAMDMNKNYFSQYVPEIVLTEITRISDKDVRISYTAVDAGGGRHEGFVHTNESTKAPLPNLEDYEVWGNESISGVSCAYATETNPGVMIVDGRIRCLAQAFYCNVNSNDSLYDYLNFSKLWIVCEYDADSDSFLPVSVELSLGREERLGEERWVEISIEEMTEDMESMSASVPEFLSALAEKVILDEAEFTVWGELIKGAAPYTMRGFIPCELVMDGKRSRSLYTEDGLVIVERRNGDHDNDRSHEYDYLLVKDGRELWLKLDDIPLYAQNLGFYFYDVDGDGSDELWIGGWGGEGAASFCRVVRLETMTEIPIAVNRDEDYFSRYVPEISITEIMKISDEDIRLSYTATDMNGNIHEGYQYLGEGNWNIHLPLTENEKYEIISEAEVTALSAVYVTGDDGLRTPDGRIHCTCTKYCYNVRSFGAPRSLAQLDIYCEYDPVTDSFLPVSVELSLGNEEQDGEEQWVEIETE